MKFRTLLIPLLLSSMLFLVSLSSIIAQEPENQLSPELAAKIDPRIVKQLSQNETALTNIMVIMRDRPNLASLRQQPDLVVRRQALLSTLQASADQSQAGVRALLAEAQMRQQAVDIQPFWIVNRIAARATWSTVLALAAREEVELVRLQETINLPPNDVLEGTLSGSGSEWGIKRIGAPDVWSALKIDGTGVVVANIDSGVDFLHPDLQMRYRGYRGGNLPATHTGNWYDSTGDGTLYPVDLNGHGTHTMGTITADNGVGVAPGAQWIAVRAFNSSGSALEPWIHEAFQWLLAPNGDPTLAPDIVSNSWSNNNPSSTVYQEDVERLLDAGIFPVFAAGNVGPGAGSVGSPASLDFILAVGATDIDDDVAGFSSRGPSPTGKVKPEISAPGVAILSTWPGGSYVLLNGTSMATPHIAGVIALMRQADPTLTYEEIKETLTATATPLGSPIPNNQTGWGVVNAYAAVQRLLNAGQITGFVTNQTSGQPINQATVSFIKRPSSQAASTTTNIGGSYFWAAVGGNYDITASAFGYESQTILSVQLITGTTVNQNFALAPVPGGTLRGTVTELGSSQPLSAAITIDNTPIAIKADSATGAYNLSLPPGTYTMTVAMPGHRIVVIPNITINFAQTVEQNIALPVAPTILLVDSGYWYNSSQINYYQQALDAAHYYYDNHRIKSLPDFVPSADQLKAYEVVIWSSPYDSPGIVAAHEGLAEFLDRGGKLLLSGQDIGFWDDGQLPYFEYYSLYLNGKFIADESNSRSLSGVKNEIFDGLTLSITDGDGADNQVSPDVIGPTNPAVGEAVLDYANQPGGGYRVGTCLPYRAVNLPFGLEGVSEQADRVAIIENTLDWFQSGPVLEGIKAAPESETKVGSAGTQIIHTFYLQNLAETGPDDTFSVSLGSHNWDTTLSESNITLASCQTALVTITVTVPPNVTWQDQDVLPITVGSSLHPGLSAVITRTSKAPATVLLVDDDRWYNFEDQYMAALNAAATPFDRWDVLGSGIEQSPPLATLRLYPMVIWYTGYDWYNPLTTAEEATLKAYLDGGGRLILSSQEYLYNLPDQKPSDFSRDYLGIQTYTEAYSSTMAVGVAGNPLGNQSGPYVLNFPAAYENWTDVVTPTAQADIAMLNQFELPAALTLRGGGDQEWHTSYFGFGLELLNEDNLTELLRRGVGWLSWLGTSEVTVDLSLAAENDVINYTAVIHNDGLGPLQNATFTATFPWPLSLVPGSATGAIENGGNMVWNGPLAKDESRTFTYQARVATGVPYGTMSQQISWFGYDKHALQFDRVAAVPVNIPDWHTSHLTVDPAVLVQGEVFTYTLYLTNTGVADAPVVTVTTKIPAQIEPIESSINQSNLTYGPGEYQDDQIVWITTVPRNQGVRLTYSAKLVTLPVPYYLPTRFTVDDGFIANHRWTLNTKVQTYDVYFPLLTK